MRIAHFIQRYPPALGGAESYLERLCRYSVDAGDSVSVRTTTADDLSAMWRTGCSEFPAGRSVVNGVSVERFRPSLRIRGRRWGMKPLSMIPIPSWQVRTMPVNPICFGMARHEPYGVEPVDAVHATAFPYAWVIDSGRRLARRCNVPFAITPFLHLGDPNDPNDRMRRAYTAGPLRYLLRQADLVFVQTSVERRAVLDLGIDADRIVLQGLGIDPAECTGGDRGRARLTWGVGDDTVVVGLLANQSFEKGSNDLLAAVRLSNEECKTGPVQAADPPDRTDLSRPSVRVVLAGPEMRNFTAVFDAMGRPAWVTRMGRISDAQKRDFFAGIDLFCMPSRSDSFGLVFLEAWANGVPVIGYRAGGVADVIRHEIDGILVTCGDIHGLRNAIDRLASDVDLRRRMGSAGRTRLPVDFAWADKLALFRSAMQERIRRHRNG